MIEARWFSTVRWLMPRSAAMFLLGWPARTNSMIWRCRGVRPATWCAALSRQADSLLAIPRLFERALDAGEQFVAADRLLDEVRSAGLHRLHRHRHVAVAGDHDGRQPMARIVQPLQQFEPVHSRADRRRSGGILRGPDDRLRGMPRRSHKSSTIRPSSSSTLRIASRTWLSSSTTKTDGRRRTRSAVAGARSARLQPGARGREQTLDDLRQLLQLHRLVELDAVLKRDIAQDVGRDIAGQNDDRDLRDEASPAASRRAGARSCRSADCSPRE